MKLQSKGWVIRIAHPNGVVKYYTALKPVPGLKRNFPAQVFQDPKRIAEVFKLCKDKFKKCLVEKVPVKVTVETL